MADPIDNAASAFLSDMGGPRAGKASGGASDGPVEDLFGHNSMEDDDGEDVPNEEENDDEGDEKLPAGDEEGDPEDEDDQGDDEDGEGDDEDEDGEDDEGEQPEGSLNLEAEVTLTVDGEEVVVPLKEALSGYIRAETFHRRLNLLNEAKEEILRQGGEAAQNRQKYLEGLQALQKQLDEIAPKEPTQAEWDAKFEADPATARREQIAWERYKLQRAELTASEEKAKKEAEEEHRAHVVNWVRSEQIKVINKFPHWQDDKVRARELESMKRTAKAVGYTEQEISTLYDSRAIEILHKAAAYDRLMAKKPKPVKKVVSNPNASGSGNSARNTDRKGSDRAFKELRKTGSVDAATGVFNDILKFDETRTRRRG